MFCYWLVLFISYSAGRGRKKIWESFLEDIQGRKNLSPKKKSGAALPDFPVWSNGIHTKLSTRKRLNTKSILLYILSGNDTKV